MTFLKIFENFDFFIRNSTDDVCMLLAWLVSSTSPSGGNQVDGLPPASSRESTAKLARLGSAKNGTTLENFIYLTMFCSMNLIKVPRISCPEYIKELDKCIKM